MTLRVLPSTRKDPDSLPPRLSVSYPTHTALSHVLPTPPGVTCRRFSLFSFKRV